MELYETTASNEIHAVLQVVPVYANVTHILNQVNVFKVIPESLAQIAKQFQRKPSTELSRTSQISDIFSKERN